MRKTNKFWDIIDQSIANGKLYKESYKIAVVMILFLILVEKAEGYITGHGNRPTYLKSYTAENEIQWEMDDEYVVYYNNHLFNSKGESVYLTEDLIISKGLSSNSKSFDSANTDAFTIYTDASRKHVLVLTKFKDLYIYDTDLNKKLLAEDVFDANMSLDGSTVFYIKETSLKKNFTYPQEKRLYIYEPYGKYDFGRQFWNEEILFGAISPNGKYLAAYQTGNPNKIKVLDLNNSCKVIYEFDMPGDASERKYFPIFVSNDGNLVYTHTELNHIGELRLAIYERGRRKDFKNNRDYSFAIFDKDMKSMVYGVGNDMFYYYEGCDEIMHVENGLKDNMFINKKCFAPSNVDDRIMVVTDPGFGGFVVRGMYNTHYYDDTMKKVEISGTASNYLYSYYDDSMMVVYYSDENKILKKAVFTDGEERISDYDMVISPIQITSNKEHNKIWVVTKDYDIYCIDCNNDTVTMVKSIDKEYDYEGSYIVRYSKLDGRLYYCDGACLYSVDPDLNDEYLVTDDCYRVDAPEGEEYLLHYHVGNYENEYIQIGEESVRIR